MEQGADPQTHSTAEYDAAAGAPSMNGSEAVAEAQGADALVVVGIAFVAGFLAGGLARRIGH
jgi:hypothetical protein